MSFSKHQLKKLTTPLDVRRIQTRERDGRTLAYLEGWFVVAEANRIFGYDGWDREMIHFERLFARKSANKYECGYFARVRLLIRAETTIIRREGTGFGQAIAPTEGEAHERSLKAAETDATKRALVTFGGRFGLTLYDKDQRHALSNDKTRHSRETLENGAHGIGRVAGSVAIGSTRLPPAQAVSCGDTSHSATQAPELENYRLVFGDGSEVLLRSPESFCTGLRQLLNAARDQDEIARLRWVNAPTLMQLRGLPSLVTARGRHYVDVLEELFVRRLHVMAHDSAPLNARSDVDRRVDERARRHKVDSAKKEALTTGPLVPPTPASTTCEGGSVMNGDDWEVTLDSRETGERGSSPTPVAGVMPPHGVADRMSPSETTVDQSDTPRDSERVFSGCGLASIRRDAEDEPAHAASAGTDASAGEEAILEESASAYPKGPSTYGPFLPVPAYPLKNLHDRLSMRQDTRSSVDSPDLTIAKGINPRPAQKEHGDPSASTPTRRSQITGGFSIDKSTLLIPSERRLRSKAHLTFVASKPCLICGETPCHAHHVTFAQPRGLSQKVSDEFTVPLCVQHHNELHAFHNEASWWRSQGIEPLPFANALWCDSARDESST